jgi:hypothetical protein
MGSEASLNPLLTGSYRDRMSGRCARVVAVSYRDSASSSSSSSSSLRGRLRGGLLLRETLEPLLATALYQHLTLEDLPITSLLHGIFLLFLLGHREASHMSSHAILRD